MISPQTSKSSPPSPPIAPQHPKILEIHGDRRVDPYHWLRDRDQAEVIDYLKAENAYTESAMGHTDALQKQLYDEMLGRIQETDLSVPYRYGDYHYYSRTEEGLAYSIYCRKPGSLDADEEVLLDSNQLAEGKEFFSLGDFNVSLNHRLLAYSTDTNGSERYTLVFKTLDTHAHFEEQIADVGGVAWAKDHKTVFYTRIDEAHRPYQLWRHVLGTDPSNDVLIYEETDESFYLSISSTRSEAYLVLAASSKVTSEIHVLDAQQPEGSFQVLQPRQPRVEYWIDHHPGGDGDLSTDRFYIVTNEDAINFKLMVTPVATPGKAHWREVIPHREDVMLSDIDVFADHLVIYEREGGLPTIRVQKLSTGDERAIAFPEPTYAVYGGTMAEFHTRTLRFHYTSMVTPPSVFDYDMDTHERELKKETPVLGGYDRSQYTSERLTAIAADGTEVPISLVYRNDTPRGQDTPLLLSGYGSYGFPYPAAFSSTRLSLLDRGMVCAIAHIRGGGEMGRKWYEAGKFLHKKNTFTDFISCATHLIDQGWTSSEHLVIYGGSAGGLLMGAVVNQRPDLFKGAIAAVPFVDIVTTILDPSLPLSVLEWDEWGNPNEPEYYDYMLSYSPYDNVKPQDYPHLLITAGLNDPRVGFWEPAKWTAKLRTMKTDQNRLLLKTNLDAGHGGASGRYGQLKETAFEYAFVLDCLGLSE
ncbi:MAG: S9 family peptidase [Elainellaceae cyanobacterium]